MPLFRRQRSEELLDKELRFHLEQQIEDLIAGGLSPEEARRRALAEFGGVEVAKEECRDVRPGARLELFWRDLRYAVRMLARDRGFAAVSVAVLALGIGGVGAVFSVINELALRELPLEAPGRLAVIREEIEDIAALRGGRFPPVVNFYRLRDELRSFQDVTGFQFATAELQGLDEPHAVSAGWAPANFAGVLGLTMLRGRWYSGEEVAADEPVAVLSEELWRRVFRADPEVEGETVRLVDYRSERTYTVIGVAAIPQRIPRLSSIELFVPNGGYFEQEGSTPSLMMGRLADEATLDQARAELASIQANLYLDQNQSNGGRLIIVRSVLSDSIRAIREGLGVLFGAAGLVLLIACANVASLLLGRGAARRREMAVRAGLGAGRGRLFAQAMTESGLLALLGGALGVLVAWAGVRGLMAVRFARLPELEQLTLDARVVGFALTVTALTAFLFGAIPAWRAARTDAYDLLRQGGSTAGEGFSGRRLRQALVAGEVALSVVLVAGAGLLIHSMIRMLAIDPGFDPENVVWIEVRAPDRETAPAFLADLERRLRGLPGVVDAARVNYPPPRHVFASQSYRLPGQEVQRPQAPFANSRIVSASYFRMMGIPLTAGPGFEETAAEDGPRRIVVSRSLAEREWPGRSAVGEKIFLLGREEQPAEIVGVVADARHYTLLEEPGPLIYLDARQSPRTPESFLIRTEGNPEAFIPAIQEAIWAVDPTQPFRWISTLEDGIRNETAEARFYMFLLTAFAGVALLLAAVGLYGVVAFSAARRTQEIGVRMALGADRRRILRMFSAEGLRLAAVGLVLGLGGAVLLGRSLEAWLYGVEAADPLTLGVVCGLLLAVAVAASFWPARRAARLDPLDALRYE